LAPEPGVTLNFFTQLNVFGGQTKMLSDFCDSLDTPEQFGKDIVVHELSRARRSAVK